ncbi:MAG: AmmeMemoRadiSam system protein B [Bacteroidetes bacterium]|nr:AmmeMemoRadiSam system protein B [Bacteroidota bacterium]
MSILNSPTTSLTGTGSTSQAVRILYGRDGSSGEYSTRFPERILYLALTVLLSGIVSLTAFPQVDRDGYVRKVIDTIGFACNARQMDSVMARIERNFGRKQDEIFRKNRIADTIAWKTAICPHDDYAYAGYLYPLAMRNIKAHTVLLIGVCHKAARFGLENVVVFDGFDAWKEPYGSVKISTAREDILKQLPGNTYIVHDSVQAMEHSLEAIVPFLQYYNRNVEVIPILIPYMNSGEMNTAAQQLSRAIMAVMQQRNWQWGRDLSIVISNDCVHYGDEEWGDSNFAFYGSDTAGYERAVAHEKMIISRCLNGRLHPDRIMDFIQMTVDTADFKKYKWTWCGRYSVPFGLLTTYHLQQLIDRKSPVEGSFLDYATSIDHPVLPVSDLEMGTTAIATIHHWVGYTAVGYK